MYRREWSVNFSFIPQFKHVILFKIRLLFVVRKKNCSSSLNGYSCHLCRSLYIWSSHHQLQFYNSHCELCLRCWPPSKRRISRLVGDFIELVEWNSSLMKWLGNCVPLSLMLNDSAAIVEKWTDTSWSSSLHSKFSDTPFNLSFPTNEIVSIVLFWENRDHFKSSWQLMRNITNAC